MPVSRNFSKYPSGSPREGAPPPGSLYRAPTERDTPPPKPPSAIPQSPGRRTHPSLPNGAAIKRDSRLQSLPFITLGVSKKEAPPPPGSPNAALMERAASSAEPAFNYLRVPGERTYPSPEPSYPCPSGFPESSPLTELPHRKMLPFRSPQFIYLLISVGVPNAEPSHDRLGNYIDPPSRARIFGESKYNWEVAWCPRVCC
jgi:hypothetical protein